jgi:hypothetical protein
MAMNLPRMTGRYLTGRALRGVGMSYPAATATSLWAWPWRTKKAPPTPKDRRR